MGAGTGIAAVVLAGGRSARWGRDKALAAWGARRLIDHVVDRLPAERTETIVVVRTSQGADGWSADRVVHDDPELPACPLRGMIAGLAACRADRAWVVACDQPLLEADLLRRLAAEDAAAVVPRWDGRPQPLVGLYRTDLAPALARRLATGDRSVVGALARLDVRHLDESVCRQLDPSGGSFLNLNRPEDLAALAARLGDRPGAST